MNEYLALKTASRSKTGERIAARAEADVAHGHPQTPDSSFGIDLGEARSPLVHKIKETFIDDATQLVRCLCGNETTFGRERDLLLNTVKRPRDLSEFVCTGKVVTLRLALIREV